MVAVERDHQVALGAVVDDRAQLGVVVGGVADLGAEHVEVLVVHHPHQALVAGQVLDLDLPHQDVAVEVHHVVAVEHQLQVAVLEADAGGEGVAEIPLADLPAGVAGPEQLAAVLAGDVGVDAEPARPVAGVVLLPDVGEIEVAQLVLVVEGDEQPPVADRDVTRHGPSLSRWPQPGHRVTCTPRKRRHEATGQDANSGPPYPSEYMSAGTAIPLNPLPAHAVRATKKGRLDRRRPFVHCCNDRMQAFAARSG